MTAAIDRTGQRYGRLLVLHRAAPSGERQRITWRCRCDCGTELNVVGESLGGNTQSCGCLKDDAHRARLTTHGAFGTKEYRRWARMLDRCRNPANTRYKRYGGRGITVCDAWLDYDTWFRDIQSSIGPWPGKGWTLDRIKNDEGYRPGNVRWADAKMQRANRSATRP